MRKTRAAAAKSPQQAQECVARIIKRANFVCAPKLRVVRSFGTASYPQRWVCWCHIVDMRSTGMSVAVVPVVVVVVVVECVVGLSGSRLQPCNAFAIF